MRAGAHPSSAAAVHRRRPRAFPSSPHAPRPLAALSNKAKGHARKPGQPAKGRRPRRATAATQHAPTTRPRAPVPTTNQDGSRVTSARDPSGSPSRLPARRRSDDNAATSTHQSVRFLAHAHACWLVGCSGLVWRPVGWGWRVGRARGCALSSSPAKATLPTSSDDLKRAASGARRPGKFETARAAGRGWGLRPWTRRRSGAARATVAAAAHRGSSSRSSLTPRRRRGRRQ